MMQQQGKAQLLLLFMAGSSYCWAVLRTWITPLCSEARIHGLRRNQCMRQQPCRPKDQHPAVCAVVGALPTS
jgi:hypothetical protein